MIYADPPWDYLAEGALGYPTMTLANICTLGVEMICADDAVLFLWCSASLVGDALEVIKSWGFKYKTQAIWDKGCPGQGQYFRLQHEVLMLATRGKLPEVQFDARAASVIHAKRALHSQKPAIFIDLIEAMYPELKKVELFRRGEVLDGWAGWGNECSSKSIKPNAEALAHDVGDAANDNNIREASIALSAA